MPNPNREHRYNAYTGYAILSLIIEEVTGNPYEVEVQNRVFTPIGLTHAIIPVNSMSMNQINGVYNNGQDRSSWSHDSYLTTRSGGGFWMANSLDAATFMHELHTGNVISPVNQAKYVSKGKRLAAGNTGNLLSYTFR